MIPLHTVSTVSFIPFQIPPKNSVIPPQTAAAVSDIEFQVVCRNSVIPPQIISAASLILSQLAIINRTPAAMPRIKEPVGLKMTEAILLRIGPRFDTSSIAPPSNFENNPSSPVITAIPKIIFPASVSKSPSMQPENTSHKTFHTVPSIPIQSILDKNSPIPRASPSQSVFWATS